MVRMTTIRHFSGLPIDLISYVNYEGSDLSGTVTATNRTLTVTGKVWFSTLERQTLFPVIDYSVSETTTESTITFLRRIANKMKFTIWSWP